MTKEASPKWVTRPGVDPSTAPNKPPLPPADYRCFEEHGLLTERNAVIRLSDGVHIYADIHRPSRVATDLPVLLAWGPYGKHGRSNQVFWPASGVVPEWLSPLTPFEAPDPVFWCSRGYAVASVDPRGAWLSEGVFHHNGDQESRDCAETVEWLASQPWSNGKVGMTGVSYLAAIQYYVAALRPEALAAINPWEAFSDWYREFAYHGGIPETGFLPRASDNIRFSTGRTEDTWANAQAHPLIDEFWRSKDIELENIVAPAFVVASWSDHGLHSRGTLEAYKRIGSSEKWLEVHGRKKWAHYYAPENRQRRQAFFDHFLKEKSTLVPAWPKVRLEIRNSAHEFEERVENEWPLARASYRKLWVDAAAHSLQTERPGGASSTSYDATEGRAVFDMAFEEKTEITGHVKLKLWVEAEGADDMDIFVALQKLDADKNHVGFMFYAFYDTGPAALGWLRASHRALDEERSSPEQPVHRHDREEPLVAGEPTPVEIELWPSSTVFMPGETLRVVVQGSDIYKDSLPNLPFARHENLRNKGKHLIHAGGDYDSHLLVPVIPEGSDQ
ncbi:MAG: X-Pro dipeptidyl-peptidase domain-containing protein [Parvularcula sp.]|nr:X-Pro dipeptidyl-peptidase domain-containing protein [Parvularcula sp.]